MNGLPMREAARASSRSRSMAFWVPPSRAADLERDALLEGDVLGGVHGAHAPAAQLGEHPVLGPGNDLAEQRAPRTSRSLAPSPDVVPSCRSPRARSLSVPKAKDLF